jgi:hypothetical protein
MAGFCAFTKAATEQTYVRCAIMIGYAQFWACLISNLELLIFGSGNSGKKRLEQPVELFYQDKPRRFKPR